jgi:hypothetical protein
MARQNPPQYPHFERYGFNPATGKGPIEIWFSIQRQS